MKASTLRAEITVPLVPKVLALCIALIDTVWCGSDRTKIIKLLCAYYGVV